MKLKIFLSKSKLAIPSILFATLMILNHSCETDDNEVCNEVDGICEEELLTICTSTSEEYYVISGDTIYCAEVGDCTSADDEVLNTCSETSSAEKDNLKIELQAIMKKVRSRTF